MKKNIIILLVLFGLFGSLAVYAAPQIAVLDTVLAAGIDPAAGALVTSKIEEEFVNQKKYKVLDRANIERVLGEKEFQLSSGIVKNEEIRQAGEYLGADFVVVASVSRIGQTFMISAKMIDVSSGEIAAQTSAERAGKIDLLLEIAREVGVRLAGTAVNVGSGEEPVAKSKTKPVVEEPVKEPEPKPVKEKKTSEPIQPSRYVVGVRAGLNLATVAGDDWYWYYTDDWGLYPENVPYSMMGINAGGFFELNLGRMLSFGMEVLYSQKGYSYDLDDWWYDGFSTLYYMGIATNVWTFKYFEVPVYIKLRLPGRISPYVSLGASLSILLGATVESSYTDPYWQDVKDTTSIYGNPADLSDLGLELNSIDAGILLGAGVDVTLGRLLLNIDARYTLGLMDVSAGDLASPMTNGVFAITTGLGFRR